MTAFLDGSARGDQSANTSDSSMPAATPTARTGSSRSSMADATLTWEEAMATLHRSHRAAGSCDVGSRLRIRRATRQYPVSGVSWYEAAAYAAWAGKSLPTIFHWNRVAFTVASSRIVPLSNLAGNAARPGRQHEEHEPLRRLRPRRQRARVDLERQRPRGSGASSWAAAGTIRTTRSPMPTRSRRSTARPTNGFRCIRISSNEPNLAALAARRSTGRFRDFLAGEAGAGRDLRPVPAAVRLRQDAARRQDRRREDDAVGTVRQKITFDAAYGGERMMAYLFLPPAGKPPYQVVVDLPRLRIDQHALERDARPRPRRLPDEERTRRHCSRSTRAPTSAAATSTRTTRSRRRAYKDYVIMWGKDLGALDRLRRDAQGPGRRARLAYYGLSWGGGAGRDPAGGRAAHQGERALRRRPQLPARAAGGGRHQLHHAGQAAHFDAERRAGLLLPCGDVAATDVRSARHTGRGQGTPGLSRRSLRSAGGDDQGVAAVAGSVSRSRESRMTGIHRSSTARSSCRFTGLLK